MALVEVVNLRQAAAIVYADDVDPRKKMAVCFAGEQFAQDPASRLYLPYADFERGSKKELRVASAAGNFQVEGNAKVHFDNGFNARIATETPGIEILSGGKSWQDIPLTAVPYKRGSKQGKESTYTAYELGFASESGDLAHKFESNLGWGKGDYTWTSRRAERETFRFRLDIQVNGAIGEPHFMRDTYIDVDRIVDRGQAYAVWTLPNGKPVSIDFSDMVRSDIFDAKESVFNQFGATLYSLPFSLRPGESVTIDPTITPDAGSSGAGAGADSAWGIDGTGDNSTAVGVVGGSAFLNNYNRFAMSPIASGDTITAGAYEPYVVDVGTFAFSTADYGCYNTNGQGDPASDAYATAYSRSAVITNGENYANVGTDYRSTGRKSFTLGSPAIADLQSAISGGFFTICNQGNGVSGNQYVFLAAHNNTTPANRPRLSITYTEGVGGVSGSATILEKKDLADGYGSPVVSGSGSQRAKSDNISGAGSPTVSGSSSALNRADSIAAYGTSIVTSSGSAGNKADSVSGSASPVVFGSSSVRHGGDYAIGQGSVGSAVSGTVDVIQKPDIVSGQGSSTVTASGSVIQKGDRVSASGSSTVAGSGAATGKPDAIQASASPVVSGTSSPRPKADYAIGVGSVGGTVSGSGDILQKADAVSGSGNSSITGASSQTSKPDRVFAAGMVSLIGVATITARGDSAIGFGTVGDTNEPENANLYTPISTGISLSTPITTNINLDTRVL